MELKSVGPTNLNTEWLVNERNKDVIYRIMNNNSDWRELDFYVGKFIDCLSRDKIFPPAPEYIEQRRYEKKDVTDAQEVLTKVLQSDKLVLKRGLIWLGLRISPSFINQFCPPPSEKLNRRFLVNPEKLALMIKGEGQPLRLHLSAFCNNSQTFSIDHCVISCCTDWNSLMPWMDYDTWSKVDANTSSIERINAKRNRLDNASMAKHSIEYHSQHHNQQFELLE